MACSYSRVLLYLIHALRFKLIFFLTNLFIHCGESLTVELMTLGMFPPL